MRKFVAVGSFAVVTEAVNPIRRVVNLLQNMQKEIEEEGKKEEELFKKFMCYCKTNNGQLGEDAAKAKDEIDQNNAAAEAKAGQKKQIEEELAQHKKDRKDAKKALATATEIRKKEKAAFDEAAGDTKQYIDATKKAVAALKKGKGGAFLQTRTAETLKNLIASGAAQSAIDANDQMTMLSFLESSKDYVPVGGEIIGILSNMLDEFDKSLGGLLKSEEDAVANFKALKAAKEEEIQAATDSIEKKTELKGKLAVEVVQHKAAADAAAKELSDNEEFLANLKTMCAEKEADWEVRSSERSGEVAAIGEAIAVLNDDDALDIFKKAVDSPAPKSFLQIGTKKASPAVKAVEMLKRAAFSSPAIALLANTAVSKLKSKSGVDFSEVIKMIDDMVAILKEDQANDEKAKEVGETELRNSANEKKETETKISALTVEIEELEGGIAAKKENIAQKTQEIAELDQSVAEATKQRGEENAAFTEEISLNTSAVQLLEKAKNKLNKFYNPAMYKEAPKREPTEEERLAIAAGENVDLSIETNIAGTEQSINLAQKPAPPPATYGEYKRKGQKSNAVTALLDKMIGELKTEMQTAEHEEKTSQRDYETLVADAKTTRQELSKDIAESEVAVADMETSLGAAKSGKEQSEAQLTEINAQIADLHTQYDFIIAHFDERREARTTEIDGLGKAKAVLSGASFE